MPFSRATILCRKILSDDEKSCVPQIRDFHSIQILWRPFSDDLRVEFCVISQKVILPGFATFLTFADFPDDPLSVNRSGKIGRDCQAVRRILPT
jgi:hypothetical protein